MDHFAMQINTLSLIDIQAFDRGSVEAHLDGKKEKYSESCPSTEEVELAVNNGNDNWEKEQLLSKGAYCLSPAFYFDKLPSPAYVSKSGIDGRYKLELPRLEKLIIIAKGERQVPLGEMEYYYWAIPVDLGFALSEELDLSNDNMLGTGLSRFY